LTGIALGAFLLFWKKKRDANRIKSAFTTALRRPRQRYAFGKGDMFLIPAFVIHDFRFLTDTKLISMYSLGVEQPEGKDIHKA